MTIKHTLRNEFCSFSINELVYPLNVIMKTAYIFTDTFYIYIDYLEPNLIQVDLKPKKIVSASKMEDTIGEFYNELLNQTIRLEISSKTKGIRELIFARALHNATVQINESQVQQNFEGVDRGFNDEDDLSEISQNWFDVFPAEGNNDNHS